MKRLYKISLIFCLIWSFAYGVSAQKFISLEKAKTFENKNKKKNDNDEKNEKVNEKVKQLEAQVQKMQAELDALKKALLTNKNSPKENQTVAKTNSPKVQNKAKELPAKNEEVVVSKTTAKKSQKKDLSFYAGDYKVTPYGIIFFNAFGNTGGTNNADDPLWATPSGKSNISASGRQTRLGVRVTGGKLGNAKVTGVVEADFYGGFPGVGVGENMGVVRLRVAKAQFDWERTTLIVGQDWMIFAPNNPTSLAAAAIPQFAAAGNPWSRLPQVRVEQKLGKNFKWQGAILAPGTGDFPTGGSTPTLLQPGTGAASRVPFLQSRISYSNANWFDSKANGTIGFAGHYGRSRVSNVDISDDIDSYGLAVDWNFPIVKRVTAKGEAFFGQNLGGFQAGIFQGYNADFGTPEDSLGVRTSGIRGIRTRGGWLQIGWNLPAFNDRLTAFGSFGIDDPENKDLISVSSRNFRTRNFGYAFDLIYKLSPQFSVGGEFRRLETSYFRGGKEDSSHINLGAKYSF